MCVLDPKRDTTVMTVTNNVQPAVRPKTVAGSAIVLARARRRALRADERNGLRATAVVFAIGR